MESKSLTQKEIEKCTGGSLNEPIYSKLFSKQRWGPGHRGAEYDVCDVDRRHFRGGARLWRRPISLE